MITRNEFKPGVLYYYSDFYDKSYAIIRAERITKTKGNIFLFEATMVANSHLDDKDKPWNAIGTKHSFSNSFIYKSLKDLKEGSAGYVKTQIKALTAYAKKMGKSNPNTGVMDKIAEYLIKRKLPPADTNIKTAYQVVTNDFPTQRQIADIQDYLETGRIEHNPGGFTITGDELHNLWASGNAITVDGRKYSVHLMSYGDYFMEPFGKERGETEGFHPDTLWLEKIDKNLYIIEGDVMATKHNPLPFKKILNSIPGVRVREKWGQGYIIGIKMDKYANALKPLSRISEIDDIGIGDDYNTKEHIFLASPLAKPKVKRNPFFLPLLAVIPWWGWLIGAGVTAYSASKLFKFSIPVIGPAFDTIRGIGKSIPYLVGATAVGVASKYIISPEKKGLKLSADIATYGLLGIGIWQIVGTGGGLIGYYKNKQITAPSGTEIKPT